MATWGLPEHRVELRYEEKRYRFPISKLTVESVAKAFNLIPETILLVSTDGDIFLPEDGKFTDLDSLCDEYQVEGHPSSRGKSGGFPLSATSCMPGPSSNKWKPKCFPPPAKRQVSSGCR